MTGKEARNFDHKGGWLNLPVSMSWLWIINWLKSLVASALVLLSMY